MKIIYYITEHGLGHSSRSVAIIRELQKFGIEVVIRNNDIMNFFKKSLPKTKVVSGITDFSPVMNKKNGMRIDYKKTQYSITKWIKKIPEMVEKESKFIKVEKPDLIVSDISILPILCAKKNSIKSIGISNFIWNETLQLDKSSKKIFIHAYSDADLMIKLPLGSIINLPNKKEVGLVSRKLTETKLTMRKQLGVTNDQKLVTLSLGRLGKKISIESDNIVIFDVSDYANIAKSRRKINFIEGQNLINASDLVICKCGYGFVSECLTLGTKFWYVLESTHKEAKLIHQDLERLDLQNRILQNDLTKLKLDEEFIRSSPSIKLKNDSKKVANLFISTIKD